jgi:hypothetical protein
MRVLALEEIARPSNENGTRLVECNIVGEEYLERELFGGHWKRFMAMTIERNEGPRRGGRQVSRLTEFEPRLCNNLNINIA